MKGKTNVIFLVISLGVIQNIICALQETNEHVPTHDGERNEEKQYPNGTVVGKYVYMDDKGNPIHVKYYADGGGYGVELKSIKVEVPANFREIAKSLSLSTRQAANDSEMIKAFDYKSPYEDQNSDFTGFQNFHDDERKKMSKTVRLRRKNRPLY